MGKFKKEACFLTGWKGPQSLITDPTVLTAEFLTPKAAGADGLVVWGCGDEVKLPSPTVACKAVTEYMRSTLGPVLRSLNKPSLGPAPAPAVVDVPKLWLECIANRLREEAARYEQNQKQKAAMDNVVINLLLEYLKTYDVHNTMGSP